MESTVLGDMWSIIDSPIMELKMFVNKVYFYLAYNKYYSLNSVKSNEVCITRISHTSIQPINQCFIVFWLFLIIIIIIKSSNHLMCANLHNNELTYLSILEKYAKVFGICPCQDDKTLSDPWNVASNREWILKLFFLATGEHYPSPIQKQLLKYFGLEVLEKAIESSSLKTPFPYFFHLSTPAEQLLLAMHFRSELCCLCENLSLQK